jgi:hypothetical protein
MSQTCTNCGSPMSGADVFCGSWGQSSAGSDTVTPPVAVIAEPILPGSRGKQRPATSASLLPEAQLDAALGQATPNATYVGERLLYDKVPESPFDPIGNVNILLQMFRQAVLYFWVFFAGAFVSVIVFAILTLVVGPSVFIVWAICGAVTAFVLACCFWLLPLPALLSEWKFSVDGKAAVADTAFEHIAWVLRQRETPLDTLQVRRLNLAGQGARDYLELRQGLFIGYVGCFPYGRDLYVSWTFWVRVSPLRWLLMVIARIWQSITAKGTDIYTTLRYDSARAMREVMHSAACEGLDVAVGALAAQGEGIVGSVVRVVDTPS